MNHQTSRAAVRDQVASMVTDICHDASCLVQPVLDACIDQAIDRRWPSKVATFVPLLAFRDVQECVLNGSCPDLPEASWR